MENWWVNIWTGWDSIESWDVVQPLEWAGLESWKLPPEEKESKKVEQILGNEMKQKRLLWKKWNCWRDWTKTWCKKRVEKGMDWEGKEK